MTTTQVRAIEKARKEMKRARNEMNRVKLQETRYRGIPTICDCKTSNEVHGTFSYRGNTYSK